MPIPIYKKIYAELKQSIQNGLYLPGDLLPTEPQLESQFAASRTTIRKAIKLLTSEGFVSAKQGRGTEVLDYASTQKLNHVTSFTETLCQKGYTVTTQGMCIERIPAPSFISQQLNLKENEIVYYIQRVQCINNKPIGIIENYLNAEMFPDLPKYADTFVSLYKFLENHYHLVITEAHERISASGATFIESQILQVPAQTPLLVSKRITFTPKGPFDYSKLKVIADKYEYSIYLQNRQ